MRSSLLNLLLGGLLAAGAVHATDAEQVRAHDAWIRVLPGALPAGGYVSLENTGDRPVSMRSASSTVYAEVMLHLSSTAGGVSRMSAVDALDIPAHSKAELAPGSYHLMLMQPSVAVKPGDKVSVTLSFADGSTLTTDFVARPANALGADDPPDAPAMDHGAGSHHHSQ